MNLQFPVLFVTNKKLCSFSLAMHPKVTLTALLSSLLVHLVIEHTNLAWFEVLKA